MHKIWRSFVQTAKRYWNQKLIINYIIKKHILSNRTLTLLMAEVERFMAVRVGDFSSRRIGGPLDFLSSISLWIRADSCASSSLLNLASVPSGWAFLVTGLQTNQSWLITVNYSCCNKSILIDTVVYTVDQALKTLSQWGNMMNAPITSTLHFQTRCPSWMAWIKSSS